MNTSYPSTGSRVNPSMGQHIAHHARMDLRRMLASNLIRLRERAGLSQNALAKRCPGISQSTISRIELMETSTEIDTIEALAKGLRVSVLQLLSEDTSALLPLSAQEERVIYQIREMTKNT